MRGRRFSKDTRESVSCAAKLGLDHTIIEAVTGASKWQIQRIIAEEENGVMAQTQDCGRRTCWMILESEHLKVSNYGNPVATHLNNTVTLFQFLKACVSRNQSLYLDELKYELHE